MFPAKFKRCQYFYSSNFTKNKNFFYTKNFDLLTNKVELEQLRKKKVNGELVRARIQWLSEGEKPSKYFCNLAKKNFIEKTVRNVQLADGTHVIDQQEILK